MMRILKKRDLLDGVVYACPYCHRYITRAFGIKNAMGAEEMSIMSMLRSTMAG